MSQKRFAIIGGGAAGFFCAVNLARLVPNSQVIIFEKGKHLLNKVKISGGGRCNFTHACFDPKQLCTHYPRGAKQLIQIFSRFQPEDTIDWFAKRGVPSKTEADGRMFPISDNSEDIADTLLQEAIKYNVQIRTASAVRKIELTDDDSKFELHTSTKEILTFDKVMIAGGGNASAKAYKWLSDLGYSIKNPIPSLFTFNMPEEDITELSGISVKEVVVKTSVSKKTQSGPLLITHWGMSGPAILKSSAWEAEKLHKSNYTFDCTVDWVPQFKNLDTLIQFLKDFKTEASKKSLYNANPFKDHIPNRLWHFWLYQLNIDRAINWADVKRTTIHTLAELLKRSVYQVKGRTTNKEEFVTCGGVSLKDIDMKRMESKLHPGLHFAGEILNIDGVTGGFNFQAAWSGAWVAAYAMADIELN